MISHSGSQHRNLLWSPRLWELAGSLIQQQQHYDAEVLCGVTRLEAHVIHGWKCSSLSVGDVYLCKRFGVKQSPTILTQLQAQTRSHSSQHMVFRWASLCKFADSPESSLTAELLILIALSSNYTCTNVQTHQSLRTGVNRTKIAIWCSTRDFGKVTKAKVSLCKCVDSPEPSACTK